MTDVHEPMEADWTEVAAAWQHVGSQLKDLGDDIVETYRQAYQAEATPESAPSAGAPPGGTAEVAADRLADVAATIERSIHAARQTAEAPELRASASTRARGLTADLERAVGLSLEEAGRTLLRLSDEITSRGDD